MEASKHKKIVIQAILAALFFVVLSALLLCILPGDADSLDKDSTRTMSIDEVVVANSNRDALVFTHLSDGIQGPSPRYRVEFTATRDRRPFQPFEYFRVDGVIVTTPEAVICHFEYEPLIPFKYIEGEPIRGNRSGIGPGYLRWDGAMRFNYEKEKWIVRNHFQQKVFTVFESVSIDSQNHAERSIYSRLNDYRYDDYEILEYWHYLESIGMLLSHQVGIIEHRQQQQTSEGASYQIRLKNQNTFRQRAIIQCDLNYPTLIRSLEFYRDDFNNEPWQLFQNQGTIQVGDLLLAQKGKRISGGSSNPSELKVEIKNVEVLPPLSPLEWPEYLKVQKLFDEVALNRQFRGWPVTVE